MEIGVEDGDMEVDGDADDAALVRVGDEQWRLTLLGLENKIRFFTQARPPKLRPNSLLVSDRAPAPPRLPPLPSLPLCPAPVRPASTYARPPRAFPRPILSASLHRPPPSLP